CAPPASGRSKSSSPTSPTCLATARYLPAIPRRAPSRPPPTAAVTARPPPGSLSAMANLQARGVEVEYFSARNGRRLTALTDVSLDVADGEFVSVVGPSG